MRSRHKSWQDLRHHFTARIIWYDEGKDGNGQRINIRLKLETSDGVRNLFPKSEEEADVIWEDFKANNQRPSESPAKEDIPPNPFFKDKT